MSSTTPTGRRSPPPARAVRPRWTPSGTCATPPRYPRPRACPRATWPRPSGPSRPSPSSRRPGRALGAPGRLQEELLPAVGHRVDRLGLGPLLRVAAQALAQAPLGDQLVQGVEPPVAGHQASALLLAEPDVGPDGRGQPREARGRVL